MTGYIYAQVIKTLLGLPRLFSCAPALVLIVLFISNSVFWERVVGGLFIKVKHKLADTGT